MTFYQDFDYVKKTLNSVKKLTNSSKISIKHLCLRHIYTDKYNF